MSNILKEYQAFKLRKKTKLFSTIIVIGGIVYVISNNPIASIATAFILYLILTE